MILSVGSILLGSCHKENFEEPHNQGSSAENPKEEMVKTIKDIVLTNIPTKTSYVINEKLSLDGIAVNITYTDGSFATLTSETLPQEWLSAVSTEKPFKEQKVTIRPIGVPEEVQVSFTVDVLPLIIENAEVVKVLESEFKSIHIPEGITSIKNEVFGGNNHLEEISLPSTLASIGSYVFYGSNLKKVDLSKSILKELPSGTFESCKELAEVILPKTLTKIGGNAFYGTASIKEMRIPEGVEEIGNTAFSESGLISIELPNTVRTIKRSFYKCSNLRKVSTYGINYLGNDQEGSIMGESFQFCPNLEELEIPGGISRIGTSVLGMCRVTDLVIPSNIERIEFNAFGNASTLRKVALIGDKKKIIEDNAFPPEVLHDVLKQNESL